MQNNLGSSLIGILIATSISTCIIAGLISYMRILIVAYNQQIQRIELQHAATLAIQYLSYDIHNAGFKYCGNPASDMQSEAIHTPAASICKASNQECTRLLPYDIQQRILKHDINPSSDILSLNAVAENFKILDDGSIDCTPSNVLYYLRRSIVHTNSYTLYRDDLVHNAVAIVEGFNNLLISTTNIKSRQAIHIQLLLLAKHTSKITMVTRNEF